MKFRGIPLQFTPLTKWGAWPNSLDQRPPWNCKVSPLLQQTRIPSEILKNSWSRCPRLMCLQRRNAHHFLPIFFSKIRYNWCILVVHPKTYVGFFSDVIRYPAWGSKWCTAVCFCKLFFCKHCSFCFFFFIFSVKVSNKCKKYGQIWELFSWHIWSFL